MNGSTASRAAEHARKVARDLERKLPAMDPAALHMLDDVSELEAHSDGSLSVVLDVRGPYVALVLGQERPHVEVWWGGSSAREPVTLDAGAVERFVRTWWSPPAARGQSVSGCGTMGSNSS